MNNWQIKTHLEFDRTIKLCPRRIQNFVKNTLKPQMEFEPFHGAIHLKNKLEGCLEQKIENYRLVFKVNLKSHVVYFLWIRPKPHATEKKWI